MSAKAGCFLLLCTALLAVLLPSFRGALSCACGARGKLRCSARLCAVCLLLLHSALDVVAWRAALKYAAPCCSRRWAASVPALRSRTGRSGGVAVMGRRGAPPGLALGERPWPLMTGESAGPCGVLNSPSRPDRDRLCPMQAPEASRRAGRVSGLVKLGGCVLFFYHRQRSGPGLSFYLNHGKSPLLCRFRSAAPRRGLR